MTIRDVAAAMGGIASKGAISSYECGQRSLRIDVFVALARALHEDPARLLAAAEAQAAPPAGMATAPLTVDVAAVVNGTDPVLAPVRRWFALRAPGGQGSITLNAPALAALAELTGLPAGACRALLAAAGAQPPTGEREQISRAALRAPDVGPDQRARRRAWVDPVSVGVQQRSAG